MVCTSQPLAAQAGLDINRAATQSMRLFHGGSHEEREPTSNGIGGDAFALVWLERKKNCSD